MNGNHGRGRVYSGSSSFGDLTKYMRLDANGQERSIATWSQGVSSLDSAALEMRAVAVKSKVHDPVYHFYASWAPGERPTVEQAQAALDTYIEKLGFEGLQYVAVLQADGKHGLHHIHACVNRVDPETGTARDIWRDATKIREASREIEFEQGWASGAKRTQEQELSRAESRDQGRKWIAHPEALQTQLLAHEAVFTREEAMGAIAAKIGDVDQRQTILEGVLNASEVRYDKRGNEVYTSAEVVATEKALGSAALAMSKQHAPAIERAASDDLDPQQRAAYAYATRGGSTLKVITGAPGAGKTSVISEVAAAYRSAGFEVRALAADYATVNVINEKTDVPARVIAKELKLWEHDKGRLTARDVVFIDEVSKVGTEWGAAIMREAQRAGATVVVFGDDRQFQAVAYGDMLTLLQRVEPGVDMEKTRRQDEQWQREATEGFRAGKIREGLGAYHDRGFVHEVATQDDARAKTVERWRAIEATGATCAIETFTNAERRALSPSVREAARELGRLEGRDHILDTMDGPLPFAVGDRITIRENIKEAGLYNSDACTVKRVEGAVLHVERFDGLKAAVDVSAHPKVQHGYVSTEYRAQGSTVPAMLQHFTENVSQRSITVGATRHSAHYEAVYSREQVGSFQDLTRLAERSSSKKIALDYQAEPPNLAPERNKTDQALVRQVNAEREAKGLRAIPEAEAYQILDEARARRATQEQTMTQERERGHSRGRGR